MIAEEDLDFHMAYENEDEMGMLCREFERMRGQLEENNRRLWQMIEDERDTRAAIAHDIRSAACNHAGISGNAFGICSGRYA